MEKSQVKITKRKEFDFTHTHTYARRRRRLVSKANFADLLNRHFHLLTVQVKASWGKRKWAEDAKSKFWLTKEKESGDDKRNLERETRRKIWKVQFGKSSKRN